MTKDKESIFVEYTIVTMVHVIIIYYKDVCHVSGHVIDEFTYQPSQQKTIVTVQNEKFVSLYYQTDLLLAWVNHR